MKIWIDNNNRLPNQFSKDKEKLIYLSNVIACDKN